MAKFWQFSQGLPKSTFPETVQMGDQGKFVKHGPKSSPRLKGPKALRRKWHYALISMHLKCKDWKKIFGEKYGSRSARIEKLRQFSQGHPKPAFSKKVQRGDQGKFFKNRPKSSPCLKTQQHFGANGIIL